jgi:hypothetical protein
MHGDVLSTKKVNGIKVVNFGKIISSAWYLATGVVKIPLDKNIYNVPVQDKCFICVSLPSSFANLLVV